MNDIVTPCASRMSVETYSSCMSVKYSLISEGKSAAARYLRKNVMCEPINKTRAYYLRTARSRYVKRLKKLRETIKRKIIVYFHREEMQLKRKQKKDNEHEKVKYSFKT